MSSQKILNPFKILGLREGASQLEVKKAYQKRLKQFHPDKGGNPAHTDLINRAYKQILYDYFQAVPNITNTNNSKKINYDPNEFQAPEIINHQGFEINNFNNKFEDHRNLEHNVYQVDPSQYVERDRATYQRERGQVEQEIGQIKPIIDPRQSFNSNKFNQAFQQHVQEHAQTPMGNAMTIYQEPLASVSNLGPATSGNSLVQYTELDGGGSQGLSNLNFSGVDEGYQVNSPINQLVNDPRLNGSTKSRYQNLLQERTRMDFQTPSRGDAPVVNFQAGDWNAQMPSQMPPQMNQMNQMNQIPSQMNQMHPQMPNVNQMHPQVSQMNQLPNQLTENYPMDNYPSDNYPSDNYQPDTYRQPEMPTESVQNQSLILNNNTQLQLKQLQQVYMHAQVQLMDNLNQLLKQHSQIKNKPSWISQEPVQIVQSDSGQVMKLEKEIQTLKKTIAVQDKLLKSISLAQSPQ